MSEFAEEYNKEKYGSIMREMITPAIPYLFRWKVMQAKLLLRDLIELYEKHGIISAKYTIDAVKKEIEELCQKITSDILHKTHKIQSIKEAAYRGIISKEEEWEEIYGNVGGTD